MSKTIEDYNEQLRIALKVRHYLRLAFDECDEFDTGRFDQIADSVHHLELALDQCIGITNQICGALIYSPDGVLE